MSRTIPDPNQADVDLTGRTIGDYELIRRLGRGGMAEVYLANQLSLGRQVAFKVLKSELAGDAKYVERFHREAKAAAALNQANIVQIYEVGEADGVHFIVQEYIRGQNLKQYLQRHSVVEPILAVNILRQVVLALQRAAEHGVIHRDIKPENIMLTPSGEIKVTDFGLARVATETQADLTQVGITLGTPLYMSPEQIEGKPVDPRSDIYSLGITAYHMLVGRPPFEGENPISLAVQHAKTEAPPLDQLRPDLPEDLRQLVKRMMAKRPDDRYQNANELQKAIRKIHVDSDTNWETLAERLQADTVGLPTEENRSEVTRRLETAMLGQFPKWWQRRATWATAGVLLLMGLVTGTVFAYIVPPPVSLPPVDSVPTTGIRRQPTVAEQYRQAYFIAGKPSESQSSSAAYERAERAWKSVRREFPPQEADSPAEMATRQMWCRRADERLGELYLRHNEWDKAMQVYKRLAQLEETEKRFRTVGLAGQAVVFFNQGNEEAAKAILFMIEPDLEELNGFMEFEVEMLRRALFGP